MANQNHIMLASCRTGDARASGGATAIAKHGGGGDADMLAGIEDRLRRLVLPPERN